MTYRIDKDRTTAEELLRNSLTETQWMREGDLVHAIQLRCEWKRGQNVGGGSYQSIYKSIPFKPEVSLFKVGTRPEHVDPSCTIEHLVCQQPTEGNRLPAVRWVDRSCSPTVYRQLTHVLALQYLVNAWQSPIQSQMGQMNFTVQSQFFIYFSPGPSFGPSRQWGRVGHLVPLFGLGVQPPV
jgi:hypothetical protein